MHRIVVCGTSLACVVIASPAHARPIGGAMAGGHVGSGPAGGWLLGVDGAWATTLPDAGGASHAGWGFGVRTGYGFGNGLELHLRYDDLGIPTAPSEPPLQLGTVGFRYAAPFLFPMPFAEVDAGPAFVPGGVDFGAGGALGISIPVVNHVLVDVTARDWLIPDGAVRQTFTLGLGLAVTFGGPR